MVPRAWRRRPSHVLAENPSHAPEMRQLWLPLYLLLLAGCNNDNLDAPPATPSATRLGGRDDGFSYAVIGDRPYTAVKLAEMPSLIAQINADPAVSLVIHVGDIEAGSKTGCLDTYFSSIKDLFDTFDDPFVYTPGDNEWTDCHQYIKSNGLDTPTERLQAIRTLFFPTPGQTLGLHPRHVADTASDPDNSDYIENVTWTQGDVVFAVVNIQGSNNDLAPWSLDPATDMPANYLDFPSQADEYAARAKADSTWIAQAFARATRTNARGLVLAFQADMWDPAEPTWSGFDQLVEQIGTLAAGLRPAPSCCLEGDSHVGGSTRRLPPGLSLPRPTRCSRRCHPTTPVAPNVTRHVVDAAAVHLLHPAHDQPGTEQGAVYPDAGAAASSRRRGRAAPGHRRVG